VCERALVFCILARQREEESNADRCCCGRKFADSHEALPKEREMISRIGILASIILVGILAMAQDVKTDYDHSYNFSQLHTFAVKIGTSWGNPLGEQRVKDVVTKALVQRGWSQADEATADALVVIHGASQTKRSLNTFYSGGYAGYGWGGMGAGGFGSSTTTETEYQVGTLVVDIFSAKDKKLVFRGIGQGEISDKPEKNEKKVEKATNKMFKNFPPQAKEGKPQG
jgi:uncharacterized protein DUF4136